jgi:hypothetical protein
MTKTVDEYNGRHFRIMGREVLAHAEDWRSWALNLPGVRASKDHRGAWYVTLMGVRVATKLAPKEPNP